LARRGAQVTLTDVPWLVPLAQYNIEANSPGSQRVNAAPLRWGNLSDVGNLLAALGGPPELVLASDVVYRAEDFDLILDTIVALQCREAVLAIVKRDDVLQKFLRAVRERAWKGCVASLGCSTDARAPAVILKLNPPAKVHYDGGLDGLDLRPISWHSSVSSLTQVLPSKIRQTGEYTAGFGLCR
jgi:hypothetical protein